MLPYKNRLTKVDDFERVYRTGTFFSFNNISLKISKNKSKKIRVGFSIGVKFSKKAVERNRIKRQLRAIIGENIEKFKKGIDVVVMIKKEGEDKISKKDLEKNLISVLKKSNLIDK